MWIKKQNKTSYRKVSGEMLELLLLSLVISLFFGAFLYFMSLSIAENYLGGRDIFLNEIQAGTLRVWLRSICLFAAVVVFMVLFLTLFGQKISYLILIIKGVDLLRQKDMEYRIEEEGNDEFTELAKSINYLSDSQRELKHQQEQLREDREALIRTLSHDIRTPLTSILSYSDFMKKKEALTMEEMQEYISLMQVKAEQIKELTDRLLGKKTQNLERIEDGRFLMEQLTAEWEEILEETFDCQLDLEKCGAFQGTFDISQLRQIFDNLASNVEKYADCNEPVALKIQTEADALVIIQKNRAKPGELCKAESHGIGLDSIRRIVHGYQGRVDVRQEETEYEIRIELKI